MPRVLIVDDSRVMRLLIRRALRQMGFHHVEVGEASNGAEAFAIVLAWRPDLVLADWYMPVMNGLELLLKLRAESDWPARVGFIVSDQSEERRRQAAAAGALFLVAKPWEPLELRARLAPILGRPTLTTSA